MKYMITVIVKQFECESVKKIKGIYLIKKNISAQWQSATTKEGKR